MFLSLLVIFTVGGVSLAIQQCTIIYLCAFPCPARSAGHQATALNFHYNSCWRFTLTDVFQSLSSRFLRGETVKDLVLIFLDLVIWM